MDFEERLQKAIERGERRGVEQAEATKRQALTEEELKRLHGAHRLAISEHIEECLRKLPSFFPGFRYETIFGERGWGAAVRRDDIRFISGKRTDEYSRLEVTVRPLSSVMVIDLTAKGTIRNKEIFSRNFYEKIEDVDPAKFTQLVDAWVLEYAELYSAQQ
ncbi:MAG TPA: hypothetical protein VL096_18220 [Pirellulaceae bacterium]|nr:hypothetical protein [Pirellulaceae bacterium]